MEHRAGQWMLMHQQTLFAINQHGGSYFAEVLVADSPLHIGKMIETINEITNGKETSLSS